ncbi:MAG: Smr/MutS family protein [Rhodothermales bacterium]|nr:Smr/MutS family protein [Rhodothermales bacterium]MBO6780721.1 Smr/MutS family protein [Rhodothermales bacterium]
MDLYPSHIGERLGFDVIRKHLLKRAASDVGRSVLEGLEPLPFDVATAELDQVSGLQGLLQAGDLLPEALFDPVDDLLASVRPRGAFLDPDGLLEVRRVCVATTDVARVLVRESAPRALRSEGARFAPLDDLRTAIEDLIEADGSVKDSASRELRDIRRRMRTAQSHVRRSLMDALRKATGEGWATEDQPTLRGGRMVIPVRAEAKRQLGGIVHDVSATGQTAFVEPAESVELNNEVRELEAAERREVVRLLTLVSDMVRAHSDDIARNVELLAHYDARRAKALLAHALDARVPERADDGVIRLVTARNAELMLLARDDARDVVPLSLDLHSGASMLVISGPNAGGKSVAMKTVGLFALMLSCGVPIPVEAGSRLDRFDRLLADIGDEQSVEDDLSTFSSRLARTRVMVEQADARTLVLIDEAGTGTDPQEGSALAQATLELLHDVGARVVVTTHHAALKRFAHETEGAVNAMMRFDEASLRPTYEFEPGLPGASYAFEIADRMGLPATLVGRSRELLGSDHVSFERLLADLEERNRQLQEQVDRQVIEARKAADRRRTLEDRLEALTGARDDIREKALGEAEDLLGGVNAEVERAIREIRESQANPETVRKARQRLDATREKVGKAQRKSSRRKQSRKREKAPARQGPIGLGDQVRVGRDGPVGEVLEIKDSEAVVAIGPAHSRVKLARLVKVGGKAAQKVLVKARLEPSAARLRIDVRGKRALEAVAEVERFVDEGLSAGLERAEILHGKGTGALRASIHDYLEARRDVTFDEAPIDQGGAGVTIVSF